MIDKTRAYIDPATTESEEKNREIKKISKTPFWRTATKWDYWETQSLHSNKIYFIRLPIPVEFAV